MLTGIGAKLTSFGRIPLATHRFAACAPHVSSSRDIPPEAHIAHSA